MTTLLQACLYGLFAVFVALGVGATLRGERDPKEPKTVPAAIPVPFFGHVLGLLLDRNHYYTKISQRWNLPIISLSMFGGKIYVIKSADMIYSLQRQPKNISFWFFEAQFSAKLGGMSKRSADAALVNIGPETTGPNMVIDGLKFTKNALSIQGGLQEMSQIAAAVTTAGVNELQNKGIHRIDMFAWVQHEITMATTEAVYGPGNPYRSPEVESAFWQFADSLMTIMLPGPISKLIAWKGLAARKRVMQAIDRYYTSGALENASQLSKLRYSEVKGIIVDEDIARSEVVNGIAILANSAPVAYWAMYHVFSDPQLLAKVRMQLEVITTRTTPQDGSQEIRTIDLRRLKEAPIISAIIHETTRYRARGTGPRMVMEDSILSDGQNDYHLKKDSVVMVAHHAMHLNRDFWGETADVFDADRFLPGKKVPSAAFRGFGGGANMCPGKPFATTEISGFLAMLAMRFDIHPVEGGWVEPGQDMSNAARENTPPIKRITVEVVPRPAAENTIWKLEV